MNLISDFNGGVVGLLLYNRNRLLAVWQIKVCHTVCKFAFKIFLFNFFIIILIPSAHDYNLFIIKFYVNYYNNQQGFVKKIGTGKTQFFFRYRGIIKIFYALLFFKKKEKKKQRRVFVWVE